MGALWDELYHATLPRTGEKHVAYLGPLRLRATSLGSGYLVLTSERIVFVIAPSFGRRDYHPVRERPLEQVEKLSVHEGRLSTVFTINGDAYEVSHLAGSVKADQVLGFRDVVRQAREIRLERLRGAVAPPAPPAPSPAWIPPPPPGGAPSITHEREVVREIVKVPCRFCGQLVAVTDVRCVGCGAPLAR